MKVSEAQGYYGGYEPLDGGNPKAATDPDQILNQVFGGEYEGGGTPVPDDPAYETIGGGGETAQQGDPVASLFGGTTGLPGDYNYQEVYVPLVEDILEAVSKDNPLIVDTLEFLDALEEKYRNLRERVSASIEALKEKLPEISAKSPQLVELVYETINERSSVLRKIDAEMAKIPILKAHVEDMYQREMENLKEYGKVYMEWWKIEFLILFQVMVNIRLS
jgi:hypothetical protein